MPHSYVTVAYLKGTGVLNVDGTVYDTRLRHLNENVAREIDRYLGRTFQPLSGTYYFPGDGSTLLPVRDLISVTTLKEDDNNDGSFDVTWGSAEYILEPYNAQPTEDYGRPYQLLRVSPKSNGTQDVFISGPRRYEIIGTWGYVAVTRDSGVAASGSWGTATTLDVSATGTLEPGMTLLVDSERMYIESTSGTKITVERGVLGSTKGTHASATAINYFRYPGPIQEAAIIQASRLWKRRDSGFVSQIGLPDTGVLMVWSKGLDSDVQDLLRPFRRLHV